MGTRNLTMVINKEGETKIGQYGQWDGYPSGAGCTVLDFLKNCDLEKLNEKVSGLTFLNEEEIEELDKTNWLETHPWLSRDLGANILGAVYDGKIERYKKMSTEKENVGVVVDKVVNNADFVYDWLFCEWVYIIDLNKGVLEVYEGFVETPLPEGSRFYKPDLVEQKYYPNLVVTFELNNLPTEEEFLEHFKGGDDE